MASKQLNLSIEKRDRTGTTASQRLRSEGKIPGVLYGHGAAPLHVAFEKRAFEDVVAHGGKTGVITLVLDGKKADTALLRDVRRNPVTRNVEHVDLQRVTAHEAVHAKLPLHTVGTSRGVRDFGGVLDVIVHEIDVEGPVDELPDHLEVDVTELGIHQHASAADVKLPKGFKLITAPDTIVVSVESSKTAQHLEEAAAGVTAEQATPEVIGATPQTQE